MTTIKNLNDIFRKYDTSAILTWWCYHSDFCCWCDCGWFVCCSYCGWFVCCRYCCWHCCHFCWYCYCGWWFVSCCWWFVSCWLGSWWLVLSGFHRRFIRWTYNNSSFWSCCWGCCWCDCCECVSWACECSCSIGNWCRGGSYSAWWWSISCCCWQFCWYKRYIITWYSYITWKILWYCLIFFYIFKVH